MNQYNSFQKVWNRTYRSDSDNVIITKDRVSFKKSHLNGVIISLILLGITIGLNLSKL